MNRGGAKPEPLALITCKAVMRAHLSGATTAVVAVLLDHMNWRNFRCDPGIRRLSALTGYSRSSVQSGIEQLRAAQLLSVEVHGGKGGRNSYSFNWPRIRELDSTMQAALHSGRRSSETSGLPQPEVRAQTRVNNPIDKPEVRNLEKAASAERMGSKGQAGRVIQGWRPASQHSVGQEAAAEAALRRWDASLREHDQRLYEAIVVAADEQMRSAITAAEVQRRGGGLIFILSHRQELLGHGGYSHD